MIKHKIENEFLKVSVLEKGAELCSIVNKKTNREYIWQADPNIWGSHAPNLFPVIGALKDGKYILNNENFEMPKHGFIRHNEQIILTEKKDHELTLELMYSKETMELFPFKFRFQIIFSLKDNWLKVNHQIVNLDTNSMYFSLGGHPAFNIQYSENELIEDYFIEFDQNMDLATHILSDEGLVSSKTRNILDNDRRLQLTSTIFNEDALIFKNIPSKKATLKSKTNGSILSVKYDDFKHLGVWAKPGAPYVCIEPWLGIADTMETDQQLKTKDGIIELEAGNEYQAAYEICINEI